MTTLRTLIALSAGPTALQSPGFDVDRTTEALAAVVTGGLAIVLGLLPGQPGEPRKSLRARWKRARAKSTAGRFGRPTVGRFAMGALLGLIAGLFASGLVGAAVFGVCGFAGGYGLAGRTETAKAAAATQRRLAAAPLAIELFAAGLRSGLLPGPAAGLVVAAFGRDGPEAAMDPIGQVAERFREAAAILADTADLALAWTALCRDPATEPVGTAALRSSRTGAPLAEAVSRAAKSTRVAAQQAAQGQVRSVVVKSTAPLALCFLPAFVLIGILPTALGLLREFQP